MAWVTQTPLFLYGFTTRLLHHYYFFLLAAAWKDEDILSFPFFSLHSRLPSCAQGTRCPFLTSNNTCKIRNVKRTDNGTDICELKTKSTVWADYIGPWGELILSFRSLWSAYVVSVRRLSLSPVLRWSEAGCFIISICLFLWHFPSSQWTIKITRYEHMMPSIEQV